MRRRLLLLVVLLAIGIWQWSQGGHDMPHEPGLNSRPDCPLSVVNADVARWAQEAGTRVYVFKPGQLAEETSSRALFTTDGWNNFIAGARYSGLLDEAGRMKPEAGQADIYLRTRGEAEAVPVSVGSNGKINGWVVTLPVQTGAGGLGPASLAELEMHIECMAVNHQPPLAISYFFLRRS